MARRLPTVRHFDGERFTFSDARSRKALAQRHASFLRSRGWKARVVRGTWFGVRVWLVFQSKVKGRRR